MAVFDANRSYFAGVAVFDANRSDSAGVAVFDANRSDSAGVAVFDANRSDSTGVAVFEASRSDSAGMAVRDVPAKSVFDGANDDNDAERIRRYVLRRRADAELLRDGRGEWTVCLQTCADGDIRQDVRWQLGSLVTRSAWAARAELGARRDCVEEALTIHTRKGAFFVWRVLKISRMTGRSMQPNVRMSDWMAYSASRDVS